MSICNKQVSLVINDSLNHTLVPGVAGKSIIIGSISLINNATGLVEFMFMTSNANELWLDVNVPNTGASLMYTLGPTRIPSSYGDFYTKLIVGGGTGNVRVTVTYGYINDFVQP